MRTKATRRFTAYYKIEQYDDRRCVWRPIQRAFATYAQADAARPTGKTRVMHFDGKTFTQAKA